MIQIDGYACKSNVVSDLCILGYVDLILDDVVWAAQYRPEPDLSL